MKDIFDTYNILLGYKITNSKIIEDLLNFLEFNKLPKNLIINTLFKNKLLTCGNPDPIKIIHLIGLAHQKEKENVKISQTNARSHFGIYYTDYNIALNIANNALDNIDRQKEITEIKFLEPCVGIGIFVIAYLDAIINKFKINNKTKLQNIVNNIFCADIDSTAIKICKKIIPAYIKFKYNFDISINSNNFYTGDLLFKVTNNEIIKNDPKQIFGTPDGFDIVLTNPPYKLLKANTNKYEEGQIQYKNEIEKIINFIKKEKIYKYNEGTLNLYKLFVEEIAENYTHQRGTFGLLIPMTILNDQQSEKLRKRIFKELFISKIHIIPEKNNFFPDISQAFCFFVATKWKTGQKIEIVKDVIDLPSLLNEAITINKSDMELISDTYPVIVENLIGIKILKKINKFPKISTYSTLANLRGELDLTLDKEYITEQETELPLLKGINISEFAYSKSNLYVNDAFLSKINGKRKYTLCSRLVCQQISNINSTKRIKFTIIPKNFILGNSCNFISFEDTLFSENSLSLYYLLGILNSYLIDWRFKLTNSNNHISNYELFDLPIIKPGTKEKNKIEELAKKLENNFNLSDVNKLNEAVFDLYGLNEKEKKYIMSNYEELNTATETKKDFKLEFVYA